MAKIESVHGLHTERQKRKRRQQDYFNQGIRSRSIINKSAKITSQLHTEDPIEKEYGTANECYIGGKFDIISEVMMEQANTGLVIAGDDLVLILNVGKLAVHKESPDGVKEFQELRKGEMTNIDEGQKFCISATEWSEYLRIQGPNFEKNSKQITPPVDVPEDVREARNRVVASSVHKDRRVINANHTKNIAKMVAEDRTRQQNRSGNVKAVRVNQAGMPVGR